MSRVGADEISVQVELYLFAPNAPLSQEKTASADCSRSALEALDAYQPVDQLAGARVVDR